ncbi:MAG: helix-turn-helix transcriptional regulator [Candidatus Zixiibacteriota bacterium]
MGMPKYDRLLYILNTLRSRRSMNAARLAEECGVTERSIYRDIVALSEANVPIYYDNGYKMASGNFLPPLNFNVDEYQYLMLLMGSSVLAGTDKYRDLHHRVLAKIDAVLSEPIRKESRLHPKATSIEISATGLKRGEKFYAAIERAATEDRCVNLTYDSIHSGRHQRVVEPYFIVFRGKAFYFVAWCRLRGDFRTFRIDRVDDVKLTDDHFVRKRRIDATTYFEGSWLVYSGEPVEVVVRFSGAAAKVVEQSVHHSEESIEQLNENEIRYRVVTRGIEEIQRWILGFGSDAEVEAPAELRLKLSDIGSFLASTYSNPSK